MFSDYLLWADSSIEKSVEKISEFDLDYIWVSDEYVIFWQDEIKQYGILYSSSASSVIKQLKTWYNEMDYYKLEKNWYEIGQLDTI